MKKMSLRTRVEEFIAYRSGLGYDTQNCDAVLHSFVRFAKSRGLRHGKNHVLRLVPIHESTKKALQEYARNRNEYFPSRSTGHFFVNKSGKAFCNQVMASTFRGIRQRAGISAPKGRRQPRLYDLRHTFACSRLLSSIRDGKDTSRFVYRLAMYMGHDNIEHTYWYLTGTPTLLEIVGRKYEQYVNQIRGASQ